jgi:hypothetical protein
MLKLVLKHFRWAKCKHRGRNEQIKTVVRILANSELVRFYEDQA